MKIIRRVYPLLGSAAVLCLSYAADRWQASLKLDFSETIDASFMVYRLWLVPIAALVIMVCGLLLFRLNMKSRSPVVSVLNLVVGGLILFYPTLAMTFHLLKFLGIGVDYFNSGLLYFAGAFVSAMGFVGLLAPNQKSK